MNRIISLVPAATEIVAALGAGDELVAVSHECDYPEEIRSLPRVTTSTVDPRASARAIDDEVRRLAHAGLPVFTIDARELARLAPTVILTQALCDVCAVTDGDVRSLGSVLEAPPALVSLDGTTLDGVLADITAVGSALGHVTEAEMLVARIRERLLRVHDTLKAARAPRPRVAVIEWLDPPYAAGHWTPDLVRRAGGVDVLARPGEHSAPVSVEHVRDEAPDIILLAPCGFDIERAQREGAALLASPAWEWAGAAECWALDGNALTSRPGPRLVDAAETMAAIFAPSLFPAPSAAFARRL